MKRIIALSLCAVALAGCATPTAFAPANPSSSASGFWDQRIESNRFRVSYRGGSGSPAAQVQDYALLHAADITREAGYDWFEVVGRYGAAQPPRSSSSLSIGGGSSSYGRHSASGVGVGVAIPLGGSGPQLTQTIEIVMGRGAKPDGLQAYDATDVQNTVRARLPPPAPGPSAPPRG